jgi:hypothetical protein
LIGNKLKLFDGQHKLAAQILNNQSNVDVKVYVSPADAGEAKRLFDNLMITNLEAHSKLKQIPFYTSTLLDRLSVIYKELLEAFISEIPPQSHTEANFIHDHLRAMLVLPTGPILMLRQNESQRRDGRRWATRQLNALGSICWAVWGGQAEYLRVPMADDN